MARCKQFWPLSPLLGLAIFLFVLAVPAAAQTTGGDKPRPPTGEQIELLKRLTLLLYLSTPPGQPLLRHRTSPLEIRFGKAITRIWSQHKYGHCRLAVPRRPRDGCFEVGGQCNWADPKHPHASVWPLMAGRFCINRLGPERAEALALLTAQTIAKLMDIENQSKEPPPGFDPPSGEVAGQVKLNNGRWNDVGNTLAASRRGFFYVNNRVAAVARLWLLAAYPSKQSFSLRPFPNPGDEDQREPNLGHRARLEILREFSPRQMQAQPGRLQELLETFGLPPKVDQPPRGTYVYLLRLSCPDLGHHASFELRSEAPAVWGLVKAEVDPMGTEPARARLGYIK